MEREDVKPPVQKVWRRVGVGVVALVVLAGFIWLWWKGVPAMYSTASDVGAAERLKAITDTRTALLAALGAAGVLGTFWVNGRTLRVTQSTFRVTERGHVTDRYNKAIALLGDEKPDIRLGGIYALEQIARDSLKPKEDQATIVQVLSSFARARSQGHRPDAIAEDAKREASRTHEAAALVAASDTWALDPKRFDVHAAVTVLGRFPIISGVPRGDLTGAWLPSMSFARADFGGAKLSWANLSYTNFTDAMLADADLIGADLSNSLLMRTNLKKARAQGDTVRAKFCAATFDHTVLIGADLVRADMRGALLKGASLDEADLTYADLSGALIDSETTLRGTIFRNTNLFDALLDGVDLSHVVGLTQEQVDAALVNEDTALPPGLVRPGSQGACGSTGPSEHGPM